ncbi:MAG: M20/M25/M40 family metallo-hydrolase [Chloroflexi bacterium]|nr:MAG: M20/M25/M40 family metallo-hydrolase [Chloroflexota bacterium]
MLCAIRPERGPDARPHSARDRGVTRPAGDIPAQAPFLVADQVRDQRFLSQRRQRRLESPRTPPDRRSPSADRHRDDRDRFHDRGQLRPDPLGDNRRLRPLHRGFRPLAAASIAASREALARKALGPQRSRRRRTAPFLVAEAEQAITHPSALISRPLAFLAALAFCAILLTSCGGGNNGTPAPTATQSPATPAPSTPTPTPGLGSPQFEAARALQHVHALAVDIGIRAAGTDGEKRAADYIRAELAKDGYDTSLQPFPIQSFVDVKTSLDLLSPQQRSVDAAALGGSTSGSIEGALVAAGRGFPQEFPSGTTGSVVLIERGDIEFSDKVANATAAGAAGVIIYNNDPGSFTGQLTGGGRIPVAAISREDGQVLLDLINTGATTVRLTVETRTDTHDSQNVVAKPPGKQCRVVVGGHYDSVPAGPGANDNASGSATSIEMARAMAADGVYDPVCFVLFGSEELGLLGSAAYVRSLLPDDMAALKAMLNFDMLAVGDAWPLAGSQSVVTVAAQEADRLSIPHSIDYSRFATGGSDHASFINQGIPAMIFNCFCDTNYHSAGDRFEFVREDRLAQAGGLGMATVQALLAQ